MCGRSAYESLFPLGKSHTVCPQGVGMPAGTTGLLKLRPQVLGRAAYRCFFVVTGSLTVCLQGVGARCMHMLVHEATDWDLAIEQNPETFEDSLMSPSHGEATAKHFQIDTISRISSCSECSSHSSEGPLDLQPLGAMPKLSRV